MMEDQNENSVLTKTMEDLAISKSYMVVGEYSDPVVEKKQEIFHDLRETIATGGESREEAEWHHLGSSKNNEIGDIRKTAQTVSNKTPESSTTMCGDSSLREKESLVHPKMKNKSLPLLSKGLGYMNNLESRIVNTKELSNSLYLEHQSVGDETRGAKETMGDQKMEKDEKNDDQEENEIIEDEVDAPQIGIVGPAIAVRDIVNKEEFGMTEFLSLPSENQNNDNRTTRSINNGGAPNVTEWIERSRCSNDTDPTIGTKRNHIETTLRHRKKSLLDSHMASGATAAPAAAAAAGPTRKSQRIVTNIIRRSIKCLNKMHAAVEYGSSSTSVKKLESTEKRQEDARDSPKVAQNRQNGAALPEETATSAHVTSAMECLCPIIKRENHSDAETERQTMQIDSSVRPVRRSVEEIKEKKCEPSVRMAKSGRDKTRKRRSTDYTLGTNCTGENQQFPKKICVEQRERFIESLVGTTEKVTTEELASRADQLRIQVQALDDLARAKEMEWNEILSMRKLKEEAYLRIERRRQVVGFMESNSNGQSESLPPAILALVPEWESAARSVGGNLSGDHKDTSGEEQVQSRETQECQPQQQQQQQQQQLSVITPKCDKTINQRQRRTLSKQLGENGRKTQQQQAQISEQQSLDNRQIGEGRQGAIVDVRSIIADYRLRHPETVPRRYDKKQDCPAQPRETTNTLQTSGLINVRRGRRMRNSVNIGLGAGGAMVETGHNVDSRPSSTDSCKSNTNPTLDPNNPMSFKDVLVQFAKLSQQQGEPVKTPQNYPDVTLHPVTPSPVVLNSTTGSVQTTTGSLLHGILTKSHSPRPTTFSPTLARLLTAPERERNSGGSALSIAATSIPQHRVTEQTQHLLHTYQGSNPVSISDLLSSSKARTEITITPVVNPVTPINTSQSNSLVHVDDVEEDTALIDERDSRLGSGARDNRDERDSPPRCQGCQERAAQFVCAGCGNQWYCSRDCQVAAWDEHSEICSG